MNGQDGSVEFSADLVEGWRHRAAEASQAACAADDTEGWSVGRGDPATLIDAFDRLTLRPGTSLQAYVYRRGGNGHARVVALPDGVRLPEPAGGGDEPPVPDEALDGVMLAIDGDGSPESFLQAAVLERELAAFCARGHGATWRRHHVLDRDPWSGEPVEGVSPTQRVPTGVARMWSWTTAPPTSFAPAVAETGEEVVVTLCTYTAIDVEQIIRHTSTYRRGSYRAESQSELLGTGRRGYLI